MKNFGKLLQSVIDKETLELCENNRKISFILKSYVSFLDRKA